MTKDDIYTHQYEVNALKRMGFTAAEIRRIWNTRNRTTAKGAASHLRRVIVSAATRMGSNAEQEVAAEKSPAEQARFTSRAYAAMWESGPYEWGTIVSFLLCGAEHWTAEPHYSFDVHFFPIKD